MPGGGSISSPDLQNEGLCAVLLRLQQEAFERELSLTGLAAEPLDDTAGALRRSDETFLVARGSGMDDNEAIGLVAWRSTARGVEATRLFVDSRWQRRGIARALFVAMIEEVGVASPLLVEAALLNPAPIALCRSLGFMDGPRREIGPGITLLELWLNLR